MSAAKQTSALADPPSDHVRNYWRSTVLAGVGDCLGHRYGAIAKFYELVSITHELRQSMQVLLDDLSAREHNGERRSRLELVCQARCMNIALAFHHLGTEAAQHVLAQVRVEQHTEALF